MWSTNFIDTFLFIITTVWTDLIIKVKFYFSTFVMCSSYSWLITSKKCVIVTVWFFLRISGEVNKLIIWSCVLDVLTCMDGINWLIRIFIMKNIVFYWTEILVDCNILRNAGNTDLWSLINCHFEISFLISSQAFC